MLLGLLSTHSPGATLNSETLKADSRRIGPCPPGRKTWLNKQFGSKLVAKSAFLAGFSGYAGL